MCVRAHNPSDGPMEKKDFRTIRWHKEKFSVVYTNTRVVGMGFLYFPVMSIDFRNLPGQSHKELPSFFSVFLFYVWINIIIIWIKKQISIWIKFSWQYLHTQKNKNKQNSIRPHIFSIPNRWKRTGRKLLGRSKVFVFFCHVCSPYKTISLEGNVLLLLWKTKNSLF